jgi:ubiquinone/menaquinone biosynthesis C-methylase UbiE
MDAAASIRSQFGPVARNYADSHFHADPERLREVLELAEPRPEDVVLDVATGTGHTALALAPHVAWVVGLDLTPEMLELALASARQTGTANTSWVLGDAAALPFPADSFDVVAARAAPHHFPDLAAALAEARRVLRPGGRAVFVDCSPPAAARDFLHEIELARDPTHVLSHTLEEWDSVLRSAGFAVEVLRRRELECFSAWMGTMNVSESTAERLAESMAAAPAAVRELLRPELRAGRLWHRYWHALIRARKPASPAPSRTN